MKLNLNLLEPYKDNYNIYNLITKIDVNYRLYFDKVNKCFYILNIAKNNQICLKFSNFSLNILKTLQMTRIENSQNLFKFIENNNTDIYEHNKQKCANSLNDALCSLFEYSRRINSISKNDISKIIKDTYA